MTLYRRLSQVFVLGEAFDTGRCSSRETLIPADSSQLITRPRSFVSATVPVSKSAGNDPIPAS